MPLDSPSMDTSARPSDTLPRHPIRVVAQRTGLTPATLRAWERRYGVVEPHRSDGGQRLYSDRDVARLLRLRLLSEAGRPISLVAVLGDGEAEALLQEDRDQARPGRRNGAPREEGPGPGVGAARITESAFRRVQALDAEGLELTLRRAAVTLGAHPFLEEVLGPLLHRVGSAWEEGELTPAQEHLCTAVTERVLGWLAEPSTPDARGPRLVVATLPGERHGLGARLVAAAAALEGWRVTHLGIDLPPADIAAAAKSLEAAAVAVSLVNPALLADAVPALAELRLHLGEVVGILLGGAAASRLGPDALPPGTEVVGGLGALKEALAALA